MLYSRFNGSYEEAMHFFKIGYGAKRSLPEKVGTRLSYTRPPGTSWTNFGDTGTVRQLDGPTLTQMHMLVFFCQDSVKPNLVS